MAGIVDARRDLVDDQPLGAVGVAGDEHLDAEHADIVERRQHLARRSRRAAGSSAGATPRRHAGAGEDVALVLVLAEVVGGERAFEAARGDHRDLALEGDEALQDHRRGAQRAMHARRGRTPSRISAWPLPS